MRTFHIKVICFVFPLVFLLVAINYFGDAANLFSNWYEIKISSELLKGHHVTNIENYNERLLQRELISKSKSCPEVLVIGSSRVMQINSKFVNRPFFNNGLSGASIEDLYAVVNLYEQKNCLPQLILIGLDPWTLNDKSDQNRWKFLSNEYQQMLKKIGLNFNQENDIDGESSVGFLASQLFSPSYFQSCLKTILYKEKQPYATENEVNDTFTKLSDGSVTYGKEYRTVSEEIIAERNREYLAGNIPNIENFEALSEKGKLRLEALVSYMLKKNIQVVFFLSPYHPDIYNKISGNSKYRCVDESEKYFAELAERKGIELRGSFNPSKLKFDRGCFYDGLHINDESVKRIFDHNY